MDKQFPTKYRVDITLEYVIYDPKILSVSI